MDVGARLTVIKRKLLTVPSQDKLCLDRHRCRVIERCFYASIWAQTMSKLFSKIVVRWAVFESLECERELVSLFRYLDVVFVFIVVGCVIAIRLSDVRANTRSQNKGKSGRRKTG